MNSRSASVAILIPIVLSAAGATALGQLSQFPGWYDLWRSTPRSARAAAFTSPAWGYCSPNLAAGARRQFTEALRIGSLGFGFVSSSGTLAVWRYEGSGRSRAGGLDTGQLWIHSMDGPFELELGSTVIRYLLVTTIGSDAFTRVQAVIVPTSGLAQDVAVVTLPITGFPGELFVAASTVGGAVYVVEGISERILRYVDTDADLVPDTRDPAFVVELREQRLLDGSGYPGYIGQLRPDSRPGVVAQTYRHESQMSGAFHQAILDPGHPLSGTPPSTAYTLRVIAADDAPPGAGSGPIFIRGHAGTPRVGQDRVMIRVAPGSGFVVEATSRGATTWTSLAGPATLAPVTSEHIVTLSRDVMAGEILRVRDPTAANGDELAVTAIGPVVHSPAYAVRATTSTLVRIDGDNLQGPITLRFIPGVLPMQPPVTIPIVSRSKHHLDFRVDLPALVPTTGTIQLDDATTPFIDAHFTLRLVASLP